MCRINEKTYIRSDGHRSVFQDHSMCDRGRRRNKLCSDAKIHKTEYPDPTSSPIASSPLTPREPSYPPRQRRSSTSSRPSTRDGTISSLKPEIHIEFNSKKGKGKNYVPTVKITTGKSKRSSGSSASAYESPGSEASHTMRTGYPDMSPPPLHATPGGLRPNQYRNPSSDESFSSSSRVAPTYHTSDGYDTPSLATGTTGTSSGDRPIIHHGPRHAPSPTNATRGQSRSPASPYFTTEFTPSSLHSSDNERSKRSSSSYAPEITGRDEDRQRRREENSREQKRRQENLDREVAANLIREENNKHVRFDTKHKAEERAPTSFAAHEQRRTDDRRARQQPREQETLATKATKETKDSATREASKRSNTTSSAPKPTRRNSVRMTSAQATEQERLMKAEEIQMYRERLKTEALELEEQRQAHIQQQYQQQLYQQQQQQYQPPQPHPVPVFPSVSAPRKPTLQERQLDPGYYDPRGSRTTGTTTTTTTTTAPPPPVRRPSHSSQTRPFLDRRPSISSTTTTTSLPQARQPRNAAPPVSYYNTTRPETLPSARERRPSLSHGTNNNSTGGNPFTTSASTSDPWDQRHLRDALPSARGAGVGHNFPQPGVQMASQRMNHALYQGAWEDSSEEEEGYGRR